MDKSLLSDLARSKATKRSNNIRRFTPYVLDHNTVVRMLILFIQATVRCDHVVNDVALADLLGAELGGSAQVLSVVVAEVVVAHDRDGLDSGGDEEVDENTAEKK